jgi:hypothetical protein
MQDDKKKLIVVGALALVIVAVGVFQFTAGGGSQGAPITSKKEEKKVVQEEQPEPLKNPIFAMNLRPRDPFKMPASMTTVDPKTNPRAPVQRMDPPQIQPMPEISIDKTGGIGSGGVDPVGPVVVQPPEPQFSYRLSGVMLGAKPMAVFTDLQGNQRLVLLGGALDPESKVLSISKDAVAVRFHGKTLRLTVEGNPNEK